jgi:hypothetical protein
VLVVGGCCQSDGHLYASAELYDPSTGTWTATGSMNLRREYHTATLLPTGQVLVAGGQNDNGPDLSDVASAELYTPASGTWTATGSMSVARGYHTATLLPTGQVLVAGGEDNRGPLNSAELYDVSTGMWRSAGSMATPRERHMAKRLATGQVLVAGGYNNTSFYLASSELYTPLTLTVSARYSVVGETLAVTGTAFRPNEPVSLYWDNPARAPLASATAAADGSWMARLRVPRTTAGRHTIIARGDASGTAAFAFVGVIPRLNLRPAAGPAGATPLARGPRVWG